jgi:cysteine sulfinate desulfinase/cysteine desulfurase-like protein
VQQRGNSDVGGHEARGLTRSPQPVYLDYNATAPLLTEALDAMLPYLREHFGNPSSDHPPGYRARAAVDRAREQVPHFSAATRMK